MPCNGLTLLHGITKFCSAPTLGRTAESGVASPGFYFSFLFIFYASVVSSFLRLFPRFIPVPSPRSVDVVNTPLLTRARLATHQVEWQLAILMRRVGFVTRTSSIIQSPSVPHTTRYYVHYQYPNSIAAFGLLPRYVIATPYSTGNVFRTSAL